MLIVLARDMGESAVDCAACHGSRVACEWCRKELLVVVSIWGCATNDVDSGTAPASRFASGQSAIAKCCARVNVHKSGTNLHDAVATERRDEGKWIRAWFFLGHVSGDAGRQGKWDRQRWRRWAAEETSGAFFDNGKTGESIACLCQEVVGRWWLCELVTFSGGGGIVVVKSMAEPVIGSRGLAWCGIVIG